MNDYGKLINPSTLYFERLLPGPPERVWKYLTDSELRGQWLASGEMEMKIGGHVDLFFHHKRLSDEKDPIPEKYQEMEDGSKSGGTIKELDPPRKLSFTWGAEGEVTFELIQEDDKVRLQLTHRKLPKDKDMRTGTLAGWHTHLNILRDRLEGKPPKGFWRIHMPLEKEYGENL